MALDYAHHQGIIHRDIKPSNIMLNGQRNTILTLPKDTGLEAILKLGVKTPEFIKAYAYPAAYRTSNRWVTLPGN